MAGPAEDTENLSTTKDTQIIRDHKSLDHKKHSSDQTESTDFSFFPGNDLNDANFTKQEAGIPSILYPDRFTCTVPENFYCVVCRNIVKDPQECLECETFFCLSCTKLLSSCPSGCQKLEFKQLSKFALKMYNTLSLSCKNQLAGCNFISTLERVLAHEETCEYFVVQCENSLCDRFIIRPEYKDPESPLLCSDLCENMIRFSVLINEEDVFGTLEMFKDYIENSKKLAELEVREEYLDKFNMIETCIRENEAFRKRKERLEMEIKNWSSMHHPGKWNLRTSKWTCCGNTETASIGCKQID